MDTDALASRVRIRSMREPRDGSLALAFAEARYGAVRRQTRLDRGLYRCACACGVAVVALIGKAEFEGAGRAAAAAAQLLQRMVVTVTPPPACAEGQQLVTPARTREQLRQAWIGHEREARRYDAWVTALEEPEFAALTLASQPARRLRMKLHGQTEQLAWDEAIRETVEHDPVFLAHLLPYPASAYEPALTRAIDRLPRRLRRYATAAALATLSGARAARQPYSDSGPGRRPGEIELVTRTIDRTVDSVRLAHLATGASVSVRSFEDETVWPGRVIALGLGTSSPVVIEVDYPDGYRSPSGRPPVDPCTYTLEQIIEPRPPVLGLAHMAAAEGVLPPPRVFTTDG
jgi:hypothetical protein